jgi:PBSX family phage terminase large subunit
MIVFSDKQREFITMPHKHFLEVCEGTPRSGKTFAATMRYAMHILATEDKTHMIVGYSTEQAYRLVMEGEGYGLKYIFDGVSRVRHDDSGAHLEVDTPTGIKKVYWKGGGKVDSKNVITGMSLGSAYLCEVNLLSMEMVQEIFRRTYAAKDRFVLADLNPPPPNDPIITEVFDVQDTYWLHWTAKDNPTLTPQRLEEIKTACSKSPFLWKRDWLGERCMPEGVVYWMFDSNKHILNSLPSNLKVERMYFSGDGGTTDATSIICWIVGKDQDGYKLYQVGNYYYDMKQKALSTQAKEIVGDFIPYMRQKYNMKETGIYIDPACKALILEIQQLGLPAQRADNNAHDVGSNSKGIKCGIEMLQSSMTEGRFYLVDDDRFGTGPAVKEMGLYCVDKRGNPVDAYNHWCDAARYGHNQFAKNYGFWYGTPRAR